MPRKFTIAGNAILAAIAAGTLTELSSDQLDSLVDDLNDVVLSDEPVFGHFYVGDTLRIRASANPALVGTIVTVVDEDFGSADNVLVVHKPSGKRIGYTEDDLRANKLEHV